MIAFSLRIRQWLCCFEMESLEVWDGNEYQSLFLKLLIFKVWLTWDLFICNKLIIKIYLLKYSLLQLLLAHEASSLSFNNAVKFLSHSHTLIWILRLWYILWCLFLVWLYSIQTWLYTVLADLVLKHALD